MHFACFDFHPRKAPLFQLRCERGFVSVIYAPLRRACQLLPRAAFSLFLFFTLFFFFFSKKQPASSHLVNQPPPRHIAKISLLLGHVRCFFFVVVRGRGRSLISTHGVHFSSVEHVPHRSTHIHIHSHSSPSQPILSPTRDSFQSESAVCIIFVVC